MPNKKSPAIPFESALTDLLSWFRATHAKGLIIGGIAASFLGKPRTTLDIDALVLMEQSQWENFLKEGDRFGFSPRLSNALPFAFKNRVLLMRHSPSGVDIDISFGSLPFEEESLKRSRPIRIGSLTIPLPSPEDLVIMKAVAHRQKDMADIESLLEAHPKMDLKRVRKWVKDFADVLESPDICSDLERLIKSAALRK
jgi:hypothetical protein